MSATISDCRLVVRLLAVPRPTLIVDRLPCRRAVDVFHHVEQECVLRIELGAVLAAKIPWVI